MLTPACNALMQFSKDRDKPIFVIGSGKTAMDTMNALDSELGASVAGRIRCVTGHGAWFMMRDPPPDRPEEPDPFARWFDYDGSNGAAINKMLGEQGQLHSPCKTGNFSINFAHTAALKASPWHSRPGAHDVRQRDLLPRGGGGGASDPDAGGREHPQGAPRGHRAGGEPGPSAAPIPSCDHQDLLILASGDLCGGCAPASAPRCVPRKPCNSPTSLLRNCPRRRNIPEELLPLLQSKQCRNRAFRFVRAWAQGGEELELSLVLRPIGWQEGQPLQHLAVPRGTFLINCKTPSPFCLKFAREF